MSGFPPKSGDQASLFDHLVGAGEQHWRDFEAERLGCFEVNRELVFRRVLHRQVGRFLALQNAVNVIGEPPIGFRKSGP